MKLLSIYFDLCVYNTGVVCHQLGLLGTDLHAVGCGGFFTVSIGGRTITNLHFADDIDCSAGEEEELAKLVEHLDKASTAYGMKISAKKTKLMTNNTSGIYTDIRVNGQKLETVTSFKYLGSVVSDEGAISEISSRIAQTTAALTRLKPV